MIINFDHFIFKIINNAFSVLYEKYFYLVIRLIQTQNYYNGSRIVLKSTNFVIVNKGYDLKINSNNVKEVTVQTFLKASYPKLASPGLYHEFYFVHRLDYSTSGLMCIPIHKKACQEAAKAIEQRLSKKYYVALIRGYLSADVLDLNYPIGRNFEIRDMEKMCVTETKAVKRSRTLLVALEKGLFDNYPATKVLVRPITGRRHQIRVHCCHLGHTIVGDYTYSNKKDSNPSRMYLHSLRLVLPTKIETIDVETDDPFTETLVKEWTTVKKVHTFNQAFQKIDDLATGLQHCNEITSNGIAGL